MAAPYPIKKLRDIDKLLNKGPAIRGAVERLRLFATEDVGKGHDVYSWEDAAILLEAIDNINKVIKS